MPESALISLVGSTELTEATSKVMADTVRQFVNHPDKIHMKSHSAGTRVTLVLTVAPGDLGQVIGRHGRTARSLRILLGAISIKTGVHFELDIQAVAT